MFDNIYKKDHSENIRIFSDIGKNKNYSNYSVELNQLFGDNSYEKFYKNLIYSKKMKSENFTSVYEKSTSQEKNTLNKNPERQFDPELIKEALKKMAIKEEEKKARIKNRFRFNQNRLFNSLLYLKKHKNKKSKKKSSKKEEEQNVYLPDVPDVGRYNPLYDVLRKHTYKASFSTTNFKEYKKLCEDKNNFINGERNKNKNKDKDGSNFYTNEEFIELLLPPDIKNNKNNNKFNIISTNHNNNKKEHNYYNNMINTDNNINHYNKNKKLFKSTSNLTIKPRTKIIRNNGDVLYRCYKHFLTRNKISQLSSDPINTLKSLKSLNSLNTLPNNHYSSIVTTSLFNNNHCMKFETYSSRKPMFGIVANKTQSIENYDNNNIKINNYINFSNKNKKKRKDYETYLNFNRSNSSGNVCLKFDKVNSGSKISFFDELAGKNTNPPLGLYNPNYNSVLNKVTPNIFLNKNNDNQFSSEKVKKLKHIIYSFNVPSDYQIAPTLND